ncbi:hypothetical protein [Streptomyces sp. NEAU-YJ-81]|uniref:hypothetical protein n=1 Tax=Streptomyces sp. NEAU-YJ-81 TaxID=2820288 RepID=UPI001ABCEBDF|nr:hypothetical protein [Streptomyces sp. NEAU-YJ-81]MBO3679941.1 hypothetical protein [Streptomyces sp. NEAU-YJ-81]
MLLGARVVGADGQPGPDKTDTRVKAGVLLAATGIGGDTLKPFAGRPGRMGAINPVRASHNKYEGQSPGDRGINPQSHQLTFLESPERLRRRTIGV